MGRANIFKHATNSSVCGATLENETREKAETDRQTDRPIDRQIDRQAGRQPGRQADRQADRARAGRETRGLARPNVQGRAAVMLKQKGRRQLHNNDERCLTSGCSSGVVLLSG